MKCKIECFIAFAFMMGSFFTMTVDKSIFRKFYRNLNDKQRKIYKSIKRDRMKIFLKGSFFGIGLSLVFRTFYKADSKTVVSACTHSLIYSVVQYLYYSLHPKKDWMLNHLKDPKLIKMWLEKYKLMKNRWHCGLFMGIIGYGLMCYVLENNLVSIKM